MLQLGHDYGNGHVECRYEQRPHVVCLAATMEGRPVFAAGRDKHRRVAGLDVLNPVRSAKGATGATTGKCRENNLWMWLSSHRGSNDVRRPACNLWFAVSMLVPGPSAYCGRCSAVRLRTRSASGGNCLNPTAGKGGAGTWSAFQPTGGAKPGTSNSGAATVASTGNSRVSPVRRKS